MGFIVTYTAQVGGTHCIGSLDAWAEIERTGEISLYADRGGPEVTPDHPLYGVLMSEARTRASDEGLYEEAFNGFREYDAAMSRGKMTPQRAVAEIVGMRPWPRSNGRGHRR